MDSKSLFDTTDAELLQRFALDFNFVTTVTLLNAYALGEAEQHADKNARDITNAILEMWKTRMTDQFKLEIEQFSEQDDLMITVLSGSSKEDMIKKLRITWDSAFNNFVKSLNAALV